MDVKTEHSLEDVRALLPLIEKVVARAPDYSFHDFLCFLTRELASPSGMYQMWSVWDDGGPIGYALAIVPTGLSRSAHVLHVEAERPGVTDILQTEVEQWAVKLQAKTLTLTTTRSPRAIERRYGFHLQSHLLVKELRNGQ